MDLEYIMKKWKNYKKIISYFKEKKLLIFIYLITSLTITGINTIVPVFDAKSLEAITKIDISNMLKFALILFICNILLRVISYINTICSAKIQDSVEIKIKEDVSKELFNLEIKNFDKEGTAFFAERINNEPRVLASIFNNFRYNLTYFLTSLGVVFYVFYVNVYIAIYFLMFSFIFFIISIRRTKRWENERKKYNEMHEKYSSNFGELIRGIKDIKVLNLKNALIKKTTKDQKAIIKYDYETRLKDEKVFLITNFLDNIFDLLFIVLSIVLIKNNLLNGANLLVIYMYKGKATGFVDSLAEIYRNFKNINLSIERLYEIVDGDKYSKEVYGDREIKELNGKIEFKDIYFGYDKSNVLKGINFTIKPNETIGIVGKSGVGKTTMFNLINKLYTPNEGSILFDDININELTENTIRENISTITQSKYY